MQAPRFIAVLVLALTMMACEGPDEQASGEEIFMDVCARCHSSDLSGGVGPALGPGSHAAEQSDEYLITTIRDGRGRMPSFQQTLSGEQIERVVAYLREQQQQGS